MIHQFEAIGQSLIEMGLLTEEATQSFYDCMLQLEINVRPKTEYIQYIERFNELTAKQFNFDPESRKLFYTTAFQYSISYKIRALTNALTNPYFKTNPHLITPSVMLEAKNLANYGSYVAPIAGKATKSNDKVKKQATATDYNDFGL